MNTTNIEHTNNEHATAENTATLDPAQRSLRFWLKAADRFMGQSLAEAFEAEGVSRREWRGSPIVDRFRTRVSDAVPAEDLTTTMRTLETIAREFGWNEETPLPRRRGRGFGRGHGRGYGNGYRAQGHDCAQGHKQGQEQRHEQRSGHTHGPDKHGRVARMAQQSFERGFDAGFSRGREI